MCDLPGPSCIVEALPQMYSDAVKENLVAHRSPDKRVRGTLLHGFNGPRPAPSDLVDNSDD